MNAGQLALVVAAAFSGGLISALPSNHLVFYSMIAQPWPLGTALLIANWPYTLIAIMPTNNKLMAMAPDQAGPESRKLIEKLGSLHAMRTALGTFSAVASFWASLAA
jgi:Anthrone oxygenase